MAVPATQVFARPLPPGLAASEAPGPSSAILQQQAAVAAISARSQGAATRLVGLAHLADFQAIIVGRSGGLRRARDLRDRRIGLPATALQSGSPRVHALRGAIAVLESEGLFFRHVQWVDLPPAAAVSLTLPSAYTEELAALRAGAVDAVYVRGPAGLEAARAADTRLLFDIGANRDPWIRAHSALLQAVTVSETLYGEHPEFVSEVLERWPHLPARRHLDETGVGALETLKTFMLRWAFIHADFKMDSWAQRSGH
jgi:ABC-type nitrate/sulfonate/bicarbonate transport system substrate-binding protein